TQPYQVNPGVWSLTNSPNRVHKWASWNPTGSTTPGQGTPGAVSASVNDFRDNADCAVLGGGLVQDLQRGTGATTPTACAFPLANVSEAVSELKQAQAYIELTTDISESMEVHFDSTYSKYASTGPRPPTSGPATARAMDSGVSATCAASCYYLIPAQV